MNSEELAQLLPPNPSPEEIRQALIYVQTQFEGWLRLIKVVQNHLAHSPLPGSPQLPDAALVHQLCDALEIAECCPPDNRRRLASERLIAQFRQNLHNPDLNHDHEHAHSYDISEF